MNKEKMKAWLSDPVRTLLMLRPCKRDIPVLAVVMLAIYYVLLLKLCSAMQGVMIIAASGMLGAAILMAFAFGALKKEEVPLIVLPVTRDASALWMALNALSGAGLAILGRKKRDEE